ncbi:MAG: hypothetical protein LBI82_00780 [Dysgonamonadaceae bacterium]|jgi:hypothetical protein|nr:hypothetical protein [Dysgonamonadaceae bacterium]
MASINVKAKRIKYILYFFLLILGVVIGIAIRHYYSIPLSETLNIVDVATLVTTIFIAVYIPSVLDRQMKIRSDKKDLIADRIDELQAFYRKINMLVQQEANTSKDKLTIVNTLDIVGHRLETIITLLSYFEVKDSYSKEIKEIKSLCSEYHDLLYTKGIENDDVLVYTKEVREKEELLYNKIDRASGLLVFRISDAA